MRLLAQLASREGGLLLCLLSPCLQLWPYVSTIHQRPTVAQDLGQQTRIAPRSSQRHELHLAPDALAQPPAQRRQRGGAGATQLDQQIDVGDSLHVVPARHRAEEHGKLEIGLRPEDSEQLPDQRPVGTNPRRLGVRQRQPACARPSGVDQTAADRPAERALVDSHFTCQPFEDQTHMSMLALMCPITEAAPTGRGTRKLKGTPEERQAYAAER
jgi:hypothetical protein